MVKNYPKNVIRLRKGKPSVSQVYWLIVILNKKKASSQKVVEQLGFFRHGKQRLFSIRYNRLAIYLNKGYKLKQSILKYIYWHTALYNKYFRLSQLNQLKNIVKKKKMLININSYFDDIEIKLNTEYSLELKLKEELELILTEEEDYYKNYLEDYNNALLAEAAEKAAEESETEASNAITNNYYIKLRKNREPIKNSFIIKKFLIGDILEFIYFYKNAALTFSGICIAMRKKAFILPDISLILRNIIVKTGVEVILSYFYNRAYKMNFLDYKRKFYTFNKNKLYFVRDRLNRESRID